VGQQISRLRSRVDRQGGGAGQQSLVIDIVGLLYWCASAPMRPRDSILIVVPISPVWIRAGFVDHRADSTVLPEQSH